MPETLEQLKINEVVKKVLLSEPLQLLIGAEEWDLTEDEEILLWSLIRHLEGEDGAEKDNDT
jgi:hypothetical protein